MTEYVLRIMCMDKRSGVYDVVVTAEIEAREGDKIGTDTIQFLLSRQDVKIIERGMEIARRELAEIVS